MSEKYEGPVCYVGHDHVSADGSHLRGGWHYTVTDDEVPGNPLVLESDGSYRFAEASDMSHHERFHREYKGAVFTDDEQINVTPEQMEQIKQILGQGE